MSSSATPLLAKDGFRPKLVEDPPAAVPAPRRFGLASFIEDTQDIKGGTLPVSVVIAAAIGVVCGVVAWAYYSVLEFFLEILWEKMPQRLFEGKVSESLYWVWIPIVGFTMAFFVGLSIETLGEPGDLAFTVGKVHKMGYIPIDHAVPMVAASQFSILGGGSLGPEAPLVAICASVAGYMSRTIFKQHYKNVVRKHTLMGMACALAAFFGVPLGGSLFALEVNSRLGYEYFEHALEAILSGTVCLVVFRGLAGLPIGPIWSIQKDMIGDSTPGIVLTGAFIGLCGAFLAFLFAEFHARLLKFFAAVGAMSNAVPRAMLGSIGIVVLGVFFPQTLFWGEFEFQTVSTLSPASTLAHVWPTSGIMNWEIDGFFSAVVTGFAKLVAISFTVAGGYRGGFIFPFFCAGACFGRAFTFLFPSVSPVVSTLCFAAGINVAITRTALASTLILAALSGQINAGPPILAASLCSLFATAYMPFIKTQQSREDIREAQLYSYSDKIEADPALIASEPIVEPSVEQKEADAVIDEEVVPAAVAED